MYGDFTRISDDPARHYKKVLKQQGRISVDADDNEQAHIDDRLRQVGTADVVGPSGAPKEGGGFRIAVDEAGEVSVSAGRMYVDGVLCQLEADATYAKQPDLLDPPAYAPPASGDRTDIVYLDTWDRHVSGIEDGRLLDPAFGGIDTATRVQTLAQVRILPDADAASCVRPGAKWDRLVRPSGARLSTAAEAEESADDPCLVSEGGGYRGLENRLYRVEVHDGGEPYAWPRGADAVDAAVPAGPMSGTQVQAARDPADGAWAPGQWVEVFSDRSDGLGEKGLLARVEMVASAGSGPARTLTLGPHPSNEDGFAAAAAAFGDDGDNPNRRVRRVASWKWSRDNGSVAYPRIADDPEPSDDKLTIAGAGRDEVLRLRSGHWVEVLGETTALAGRPGTLAEVEDVSPTHVVQLKRGVAAHKLEAAVRLRRWDQGGGALAAVVGRAEPLEDGVEVTFGGERFRTGDHWSFAARTVEADVERLVDEPPLGFAHRYARLALVRWSHPGGVRTVAVRDCRRVFLPLARRPDCCTVTVGNGVDSHGEFDSVQDAVDALPDEGGCVRVLAGDFALDEPVQVERPNVRITGCGGRTRLLAADGEPAVAVLGVAGCAVESLTLEARGSDLGALFVAGADRLRVAGCRIANAPSADVAAGEDPAVLAVDGDGVACSALAVSDCTLDGNVGASVRARGLSFEGNRLPAGGLWLRTGTRGATVRGNEIGAPDGAPGWGILLGGAVEGDGAEDTWPFGEKAEAAPAEPTAPPPEPPTHRTDEGTGDAASGAEGAEAEADEDEPGQGAAAAGARFVAEEPMPMQDISIEGNRIVGMAEAGVGWRVLGGMRRLRLVDNVVEGCAVDPTDPLRMGVGVAACDELLVRGNRIVGNGAGQPTFGLMLVGCRAAVVEGNRVAGNGVVAQPPQPEGEEDEPEEGTEEYEERYGSDLSEEDRRKLEEARRRKMEYDRAMAEEDEPEEEFDGPHFQAAAVVAAFGGEGRPALEMRGNVLSCPRGPALLAGVLGSGSIAGNELLARGDWGFGRLLRARAVFLLGYSAPDAGLPGRLAFMGNRVLWDSVGPPARVPAQYRAVERWFPPNTAARTLVASGETDLLLEGNHVRLETDPEWPQMEASVEAATKGSVRAIGNRFEEVRKERDDEEEDEGTSGTGTAGGGQGDDDPVPEPVNNSYACELDSLFNLAMGNQADHCILLGESAMNVHNQERMCQPSQVNNVHGTVHQ
jgi:hypothetical protein